MKALLDRWEYTVTKNADRAAVCYKEKYTTYKDIDDLAEYYARKIFVNSTGVVGVMMDNSDAYIVAILSVLKCGYTFVPIDKNLPQKRIQYIVDECNVDLILVDNECNYLYSERELEIKMDTTLHINNISLPIRENDTAYILYTSGTTGVPKGIKISADAIVNLVTWFDRVYSIQNNSNVLQMANIAFDVSIEEIFGCILNGGTLFIPEIAEKKHYRKLRDYIVSHNISIIQSVPIVLKELLLNGEYIKSVKIVITGGESIGNHLKDEIIKKGYSLYNHYGPTETTVDCLTSKCELNKEVVLGKPIDNCKCFIIDENGEILDKGIGELCCSGINLSLGYVNPDLDNDKFIEINGIRVYKTGDLCSVTKNGEFIFKGRIDNQVKIKGRRIELDEIDQVLMSLDGVFSSNSTVIEDELGGKIVTFYSGTSRVDEVILNEHLGSYLPRYMIPYEYVFIEQYKTNINNKISLAALKEDYLSKKRDFMGAKEAPTEGYTDEIKAIVEILNDLLKMSVDPPLFHESLERLGLDSISYVTLVVEIEDRFEIEIEDDALDMNRFENIIEFGHYISNLRMAREKE